MADAGALSEAYRDLSEVDRRREGTRYHATLPDGTPVVVLAIAPEVAQQVTAPGRFAAEFERAAALHNEGIVPPLAWGQLGDGTLHCAYARLDRDELVPGSVPHGMIAAMGKQLSRALDAAREERMVHGAISVGRIVLTHGRGAQLIDFGLFAALSEGGLGPRATSSLLSDPAYVSPEVQNGQAPDERSDIFSLGASLYELLTGKAPFGGRTTTLVMASVLTEDPDTGPEATSPVVEALVRAIERAPEDRWTTGAAFASALAAGVPAAAGAKALRSRRGCIPTAAALLLLLASAVGIITRS
jgi:serine/threonine protein kinase